MDVLIEAAELVAALASRPAEEAGDRPTGGQTPVVIDVRWSLGGPCRLPDFLSGHIPGAHWVDLETELSDHHTTAGQGVAGQGAGGRHPLPQPQAFEASMRRAGVSSDSPVIIYDGDNALAASRLWWMLKDSGHRQVRVLNGGYAAWLAAGGPVESGPGPAIGPGDFAAHPGRLPRIDGAGLAERIAAGDPGMIIDVRAPERYAGESEPIDPVAGHIPGAVNVPSMINIGQDGCFRPAAEIAANFTDGSDGVAPAGSEPIVYCGSGITAAHTALARTVAGLSMPRLYPGSWSDWITDPARPVATGRAD